MQRITSGIANKERFTFLLGSGITCGTQDRSILGVSSSDEILKYIITIFKDNNVYTAVQNKFNFS
jgi:hypothetical protein